MEILKNAEKIKMAHLATVWLVNHFASHHLWFLALDEIRFPVHDPGVSLSNYMLIAETKGIEIDQKLPCPIIFQLILVFLPF